MHKINLCPCVRFFGMFPFCDTYHPSNTWEAWTHRGHEYATRQFFRRKRKW